MAYENASSASPGGTPVAIGSRAEAMASMPLPEFNSPGGAAFAARMKGDSATNLVAVICNAGLPTRADLATAMRSVDHSGLLRLVDSGVALWPADDSRYYGFVYHRPLAPRFIQSLDETFTPISEDAMNHSFIAPMIGALVELARVGVVHNGIRPTNLFWRMGSNTPPQIGECLSAPAGYGQPVLFETLERATCMPAARGPGLHVDDCYAFGVTLAFLLIGHNPMRGMEDAAIIQTKNERGSFSAIVGNRRLPAAHIELLRGLLTDEPRQRWTAADLELWLNGRRLTPKNSDAGRRAPRHFDFAGKEYWQLRPLAAALAQNVPEAVRAIEGGSLDKWLRRAMGDEDCANNVAEAVALLKTGGKTGNYEHYLVASVCIALDPTGPIRYRGLSIMPMGIANMVAEAVITGNHLQPLSEIIGSQLVSLWVEMQSDAKTELVPLAQQYERMRGIIEKTTYGNGIERVAYELNPALPCLSPIVRRQYVSTAKAILPALERAAITATRPREPMDRHIAAYLIVRDRRSEVVFDAMSAFEGSMRRGLTLLNLFSDMQQRYGPDNLSNLAQWLVPLFEGAVRRYFSHAMREKIQAQLKETAEKGSLAALQRLIDDPGRLERDQQEFMAARMLFFNIMKEINHIEAQLANREQVVFAVGKPMAATLSSFIAILMAVVIILRALWQHMF